jgi:hypothetical protein
MRYPTLTVLPTSRDFVDVFAGYNHNLRIGEGEFYDMKNITSDEYPVLSPRKKRGVFASPTNHPAGLIAKDTLCYVDGSDLVLNGYPIEMGLSTAEEDNPKQLVSMGAYIIILPDKKYINTADVADFGDIEASVTTSAPVSFELCTITGEEYAVSYVQADAPTEPENMTLWIDTSSSPHVLKQYSDMSNTWVSIATTYIKIKATGIGKAFSKYDGVNISGLKDTDLIDSATGDVIHEDGISAIDGSHVVWDKDDDFIVVVGLLDNVRTLSNAVTVSRQMPIMDFVVESENRLWGCRYGTDINGNVVNEIYACKLGDFKNWNCFMGVSTDSYVASVGTDGQFTGAITHLGYPLFFKETCLHKIYGNFPSNYQIQTTACRGVQKGCGGSLAIVNEILYYKARNAVCAYDGSLPTEISSALGDIAYSDAVAGAHGNKYYISMKDVSDVYHLFVYDTKRGVWHKEDNTQADAFCSCRGEMYYIDHADGTIKTVLGSGETETLPVEWLVETGVLTTNMPDKKYISRIVVRMSLGVGTRVQFFIQYDSQGDWKHLFTMTGNNLRSFAVPVRPRRCDHLRLRIEGEGDAKIYSIAKTVEQGSDY